MQVNTSQGTKEKENFRRRLFTASIKIRVRKFHFMVVQWRQRNEQKVYCTSKLLFYLINLLLFGLFR